MSTDDILDRLFAAFDQHQQVTPQLMADAHAEIHRLRREVRTLTRTVDDVERVAHAAKLATIDRDTSRQIAAAVAAEHRQHVAVISAMRAARRLAERRAERAEEFYLTVSRLPRYIADRRKAVTAPHALDALLLRTSKQITEATRRYNAPAQRAAQDPERMTA